MIYDTDDIKAMLKTKTSFEILKACTLSYFHQYKVQLKNPDLLDEYERRFQRLKALKDIDDAAVIIQMIAINGMKASPYPDNYNDDEAQAYHQALERARRSRDTMDQKRLSETLGLDVPTTVGGRSWAFGGEA